MKLFKRVLMAVVVALVLAAFTVPVMALGARMQESVPPEPTALDFLVKLLFGLAITVPGFTALGVAIVNLLKIPGLVTDGNTQIALNIFNVLSAIFIGLATLFLPSLDLPGLDVTFGRLADILTVLLPTFALLFKWLAPLFYQAVRGVPGIGYSFTLANKAKG